MEDIFSANLLNAYGPFAVFFLLMLTGIGIPLGEDVIIIPAGVLVGSGDLNPWLTALAAYVGVISSDLMWFYWCWRFGTPLLHKRWFKRIVHPRRLLEMKHNIEERGAWVIVMSRFIPGSRTPAITTAGVLHMVFWKFALAECATVVVTVPLQLGLGYAIAIGVGTEHSADVIRSAIGAVALVIAFSLGIAWWRTFRRNQVRAPRAKAAWLRRFRVPLKRSKSKRDDSEVPSSTT